MFSISKFKLSKKNTQYHPFVYTKNMTTIINNSKTLHFFITGIIRPNILYLNFLSSKIKYLFSSFNIKLYLLTWDNQNINKETIIGFDYIFFEPEPTNEYIYTNITNRTIQQIRQGNIENWTINIYKLFYAFRKIIDNITLLNINIYDDDIIFRIRPDLYFLEYNIQEMNIILNSFSKNIYYFCPRYETALSSCDWFGISSFSIFKKIYYIENDKLYNQLIKNVWNAEDIILFNSKKNNIKCFSLNNVIKLRLCRKFVSENDYIIDEYK
tara:strand:- start:304 stop:1110 length:807 start_codon:yes stop_codon:yes gene_type:complete